jgi:hypothetical protein
MVSVAYPGLRAPIHKSDFVATLPNGSEIWFAGLDDKQRTEKVLGQEFATIYLNECSQLSYGARNTVITRLAQRVEIGPHVPQAGMLLRPKAFYDLNPSTKSHWGYRLFLEGTDPETRISLNDRENYARLLMNPEHNLQNLDPEYLTTLRGLPERMQRRFLRGGWADDNPNALFHETDIDKWRVEDTGELPDMARVVVAVDPSGAGDADNEDNDEIGIAVVGLGVDGVAYVLEDATIKTGPAGWANVAVSAYRRHLADGMVAEGNFGGDMVRAVISTADPNIYVKMVTASRGKVVRAEPFSPLYADGRVRHVGRFIKAEDELCAMSTSGYLGAGSPNRADAIIWALAELFPGIVSPRTTKPAAPAIQRPRLDGAGGWMGR